MTNAEKLVICIWCIGTGEHRQYFRGHGWDLGPCKCCSGSGIMQGKQPSEPVKMTVVIKD